MKDHDEVLLSDTEKHSIYSLILNKDSKNFKKTVCMCVQAPYMSVRGYTSDYFVGYYKMKGTLIFVDWGEEQVKN